MSCDSGGRGPVDVTLVGHNGGVSGSLAQPTRHPIAVAGHVDDPDAGGGPDRPADDTAGNLAGRADGETIDGTGGDTDQRHQSDRTDQADRTEQSDQSDQSDQADRTYQSEDTGRSGAGHHDTRPGRAELNPAQQQVLDELGSTDRPVFREELRDDLRAYLEEELGDVVARADESLFLSKHQLGLLHGCEARYVAERSEPFSWSIPSARGSVAHKAIELLVTHRTPPTPLDLVERAMERIEQDEQSLGDFIRGLDEGQRAELTSRANDFVTTFVETFPPLRREWRPVPEYSLRALLCDDRLTLRGKADLSLGSIRRGREAGKVLIDLKTGQPGHAHLEDLRFYALLELLKMGVPPRLLVNYYLDAGSPRSETVTEDLLWSAARRVVDGVTTMVELLDPAPRAPIRTPGMNCRWCPANEHCDEGRRHLDGVDEDDWRPR
jgi:hypothetical protein